MNTLRFLLLEDNPLDAEVVQITLSEGGIDCECRVVDTQPKFEAALAAEAFDLILADYALPGFDGLTALEIAQNQYPEIPFLFVSASLGEELAIESLKMGATDYVLKRRLQRLVPCVERALREVQENRDRQAAEAALRKSEAKYRSLFNSIDEGFSLVEVILDGQGKAVDGQILEINPAYETLTGLSSAVVGQRLGEFMPTIEARVIERYGQVALTGEPVRFEEYISALDRWFDVYASRISGTGSRLVAIVFKNITDRKQAEATLRETEQRRLQTILDYSPAIIIFAGYSK